MHMSEEQTKWAWFDKQDGEGYLLYMYNTTIDLYTGVGH